MSEFVMNFTLNEQTNRKRPENSWGIFIFKKMVIFPIIAFDNTFALNIHRKVPKIQKQDLLVCYRLSERINSSYLFGACFSEKIPTKKNSFLFLADRFRSPISVCVKESCRFNGLNISQFNALIII